MSSYISIKRESLRYAPALSIEEMQKDQGFRNIRRTQGFEKEAMKNTKESIRSLGLLKPITVRKIIEEGQAVYQIIAGERRARCVDSLAEENADCKIRGTDNFLPAKEAYEHIEVLLIENCDDALAEKINFEENDTSVNISDADIIDYCEYLIEVRGMSRVDVCNKLSKSPAWLSQTLSFKKRLPKEVYQALRDGLLPRCIGIHIMGFDENKQLDLLLETLNVARQRVEKGIEDAEHAVQEAKDQAEIAKADVAVAEFYKKGVDAAKNNLNKSLEDIEDAEEELQEAQENSDSVRATESDMDEAATKLNIEPSSPKPLKAKQIRRLYIDGVDEVVGTTDGPIVSGVKIRDIKLAQAVAQGILDNKRDLFAVIKNFYKEENED